jgi:hypothetical protein
MKTYSVVYRIGGTERFEWKRTMPKSQQNATADMRDIERMGYKALLVDHEQSMKVGVPETYEP